LKGENAMLWLWLVGRALFGLYFIMGGMNHFTKFQGMKQYSSYKNVPAPGLSVIVTGIILLGGGLSILFGFWIELGLILLALFLLASAFLMHNFWTVDDDNAKMGEMNQFLKNIALAAACLMLLAVSDWSWTL
jgi:putative oxidoreductase